MLRRARPQASRLRILLRSPVSRQRLTSLAESSAKSTSSRKPAVASRFSTMTMTAGSTYSWLTVPGLRESRPRIRRPTSCFTTIVTAPSTDVTEKAGVARSGWGQGCCIGDYDNDGFDDLVVTYWGGIVLYHNNGDGTFTDVTEKAGLVQKDRASALEYGLLLCGLRSRRPSRSVRRELCEFRPEDYATRREERVLSVFWSLGRLRAARDGWRDEHPVSQSRRRNVRGCISAVGNCGSDEVPRSRLFVSDQWIPTGSYGLGVSAADFDNDGWPDIYVACDSVPSRFYHNKGNGTFEEVGREIGCAVNENGGMQGGMGVAVGDYDCDGWLDIVKTNYSDQTANLYHNNGDGTFYDAVLQGGLGGNTRYLGWGVGLFDFDNDGWPDIFMSNGHVFPEVDSKKLHLTFKQRKIVYRNLGNGRFAGRDRR